jgi:hypothetical protein
MKTLSKVLVAIMVVLFVAYTMPQEAYAAMLTPLNTTQKGSSDSPNAIKTVASQPSVITGT